MLKNVQISLFDIYDGISTSIEERKPELISLLDENINFNSLITWEFYSAFYNRSDRKHKYHLVSFIKSLVLEKLLGLSDSQLITILNCSCELRDFCEFDKVPDASYFTRFKQNFCDYIVELFENLVDITEPICREINEKKADYLIYDTTGIELKVAENNPKFFNTKLKQAKTMAKGTSYNPYITVYGLLPACSETNPCAKQQYINGHYCYALKTGIITNGLGIIRHISVFDDDFKLSHPETVTPKTDNPDIDKEVGDSVSLKPILRDFFIKHKDLQYKTFIGDAAFDKLPFRSFASGKTGCAAQHLLGSPLTKHLSHFWEKAAAKIVLHASNGYAINLLSKEPKESVPVIHLVLIHTRTKT